MFPTRKYGLVEARLLESGLVRPSDLVEPDPATWDELALVHTAGYLARMRDGSVTAEELALLELPWSADVVDAFRTMVGGTVKAARAACGVDRELTLENGNSHRRWTSPRLPNHGEGFCPFNDVAVAVSAQGARHPARRHSIWTSTTATARRSAEADPRVFTFRCQQHNYPVWKPRGSLDIGLPDGTSDQTFLRRLEQSLPAVMASDPQCIFYLAGADPYEDDQLGGLQLTKQGLRERDRMVIDTVRRAGVPLVITLAGGYARNVEDTVAIHVATIEEAVNATTKTRKH